MDRCSGYLATSLQVSNRLHVEMQFCATYTTVVQDSWRRAPACRRKSWVLQIGDHSIQLRHGSIGDKVRSRGGGDATVSYTMMMMTAAVAAAAAAAAATTTTTTTTLITTMT